MHRREITVRLLALASGVVDGSIGRAGLLAELASLYSALGGEALNAKLPEGTQLGLDGLPATKAMKDRKASTNVELRRRAEEIVRYWIVRTGRDMRRTEVSADRVRTVAKVLRSKTDREAMQAIANVADDEWRQGENDRGKRYDGIEHIFGKGMERFEELRDDGDAPIELVHLEEPEEPGRASTRDPAMVQAEIEQLTEVKRRARAGGDRDAFNRASRRERQLRRALEGGPG